MSYVMLAPSFPHTKILQIKRNIPLVAILIQRPPTRRRPNIGDIVWGIPAISLLLGCFIP